MSQRMASNDLSTLRAMLLEASFLIQVKAASQHGILSTQVNHDERGELHKSHAWDPQVQTLNIYRCSIQPVGPPELSW